jgi:hypothetical protein
MYSSWNHLMVIMLRWLISDTNQIKNILKKRAKGLQDAQDHKEDTKKQFNYEIGRNFACIFLFELIGNYEN